VVLDGRPLDLAYGGREVVGSGGPISVVRKGGRKRGNLQESLKPERTSSGSRMAGKLRGCGRTEFRSKKEKNTRASITFSGRRTLTFSRKDRTWGPTRAEKKGKGIMRVDRGNNQVFTKSSTAKEKGGAGWEICPARGKRSGGEFLEQQEKKGLCRQFLRNGVHGQKKPQDLRV